MRRMTLATLCIWSVAWLVACAPQAPESPDSSAANVPPGPGAAGEPTKSDVTIAVVPKAYTHQFWNSVRAGAEEAGRAAGAKIQWKGPDKETDVAGQKAIVEDFVTNKVDAIVMAACDADALVPTIQKAEAAGIPVITIDSGVNYDQVRSLVATDNEAGAKLVGEKLVELIGGNGEVGCIPFVKGAASSEAREAGFKQAIDATAGKVQLVSTLYSESTIDGAAKVANDMMTSHPNLKGIFAANEAGVIGAANAVISAGKQGQVLVVGFDGAKDEIDKLRDGVVQALVLQDPVKMGRQGVEQALNAIHNRPVEKRIDTGVVVVTKENLDTPDVQKLLSN